MLMSPLAFENDLLILTVDLHTVMSPIYGFHSEETVS